MFTAIQEVILNLKYQALLGLSMAILFRAPAQPQGLVKSENTNSLVIVAFGNSITATRKTVKQVFAQRLPVLLAEEGINANVINAGIPGSHTGYLSDNHVHKVRHALDRFESDVLSHNPDLVIIGFGTNDAHIDSNKPDGPSRIPLDDYQDNLTYIIQTLQDKSIRVVLIAPSPLGEKYESFQNDRLLQYVRVVRGLAEKYKTGLVDNFKIFSEYPADTGEPLDSLLLDGAHPNDKGHKIIADSLAKEIVRLIAHAHK